jgi:hypothetical protein
VIEFARCHSRSSLYEIISGYFQGNAGSEEIISYRWRNKGRKGKPHLCTNVSENSAITTKAAMYALGNYYKSTHPTKWKNFFPYDFHFVNVFAFLRHNEHYRNLSCVFKKNLLDWGTFGLFPWDKPMVSPKNPTDPQCIELFHFVIGKLDWNSIENYFEEIEDHLDDHKIPENIQVQ